jgi:hypothetical protein
MRKRFAIRQRSSAAVWAGVLSLTLATAWGIGGAFGQNAEDEEEVPADTRILRQLLKDLGLQRDQSGIEYRERAPLVVPPSRDLPPPRTEATAATNPAWPNDPDIKQRKADAAKKKAGSKTAYEAMQDEGRRLTREELDRGRIPPSTDTTASTTKPPVDAEIEGGRRLTQKELGSKSLFSGMFSSFTDKGETAEFSGEPPRQALTAPPPGYQTPSPSQPYGIGPQRQNQRAAPSKLEDRGLGPR